MHLEKIFSFPFFSSQKELNCTDTNSRARTLQGIILTVQLQAPHT